MRISPQLSSYSLKWSGGFTNTYLPDIMTCKVKPYDDSRFHIICIGRIHRVLQLIGVILNLVVFLFSIKTLGLREKLLAISVSIASLFACW